MTARKPKVRVVATTWDVWLGDGYGGSIFERADVATNRFRSWPSGGGGDDYPTRAAAVRAVVAAWRAKEKP